MSNLLVILSDEHQSRAMGCAGHPFVSTPHLDALAARGTRFTNAYTPSPICVPARAAFATGRYVHEIGNWDNAMPYTGDSPSWGHALQDAGVGCTSIGKLHYRDARDDVGFDEMQVPMMVVDGIGMVWGSIRRPEDRRSRPGRMLGPEIGPGESSYTAYDRSVTRKAVDWLSNAPDQPWCLYVGLVAPHFPLVVPQEFYDLYGDVDMPDAKLHPGDGYARHPWIEAQNALMDSEGKFTSGEERSSAMRAYFGLCSWMDNNVGQLIQALDAAGLGEDTTVIYSSDHGDNVGARGLWGKSNFYEESAAVPLIMAGPEVAQGTCDTPVSLLDVAATIPAHFGADFTTSNGIMPLPHIIAGKADPDRSVLSEYHAVGSVSGGFMLRKGRWKLNWYVGFEPELFDLEADPEELENLAPDTAHASTLAMMESALRDICDPEAVNARAFADQDDMIAGYGGLDAAFALGASAATPPPKEADT